MTNKRLLSVLLFFVFFQSILLAQTGPSQPDQNALEVFAGSGQNELLMPLTGIEFSGPVSVDAASDFPDLLEVLQVSYSEGIPYLVISVLEKGLIGSVSLTVTLQDDSQEYIRKPGVHIVPYRNPGVNFEVHDIVFWQEVIPLGNKPVFDTVIITAEGPYNSLNYSNIPLTVNLDCASSPPCTGHDFFTAFYRGYIIPPVDGTYYFYMRSENRHSLSLSTDESFSKAAVIAARTSNHGNVGTEAGDGMTRSLPQELTGGKVYAFHATQWIIHSTYGGVLWEGPGIDLDYIAGENMMPVYDVEKPSVPGNLVLQWRASEEVMVSWDESSDNIRVAGYHLYIDGVRHDAGMITETTARISGLKAETVYNLVVTAIDGVGNESFISNNLQVGTHTADTIPPSPPQNLDVLTATGQALHVTWSGAADYETEVIGYNLYVDDQLYNADGTIFSDQVVIRGLLPATSYKLVLESVDAGFNVSAKSTAFDVSTVAFDPLGPSLGEKKGRMLVHNKNISWSHGIGLNGPYGNGSMVNDPEVRDLVSRFGAGAIRWGAIDANSKSFEASVGTGKANTYARMMHFANELDAYFALTVGVQEGIDYITNPNTFLYLLEYLAGDANTTWGAIRASEGFEEPLLQEGKGILLEFGNEVWGGASHNAQIGSNYANYGEWVREMSDVVRSSPYYDPDKIIMVYSGRYPHPGSSYGVNTAVLTGDKGHVECLGVSGYLGGNLSYDPEIPAGKSELDYYKNGIAMARRNMDGFVLTMKEMLLLTGTLKTFYLYESNMTTSSYNGRLGQALVMTDYLAASMAFGSIVPTIFHLTGGQWRITRPTEDYRPLPLYVTGQYFNRFCKGHILQTEFLSNDAIFDGNGNRIDWDPVGTYAYTDEEQFSMMLINRDFEDDYTVQLELPAELSVSGPATIYTLWHDDFSSFDILVDSVDLDLESGMLITVPRHAMVIIAAKYSGSGFNALPIGYYDRVRPDSLDVYFANTGTISANRGVESVWAYAYPEDAFSRAVVFDILEDETSSTLTFQTNRVHIRGSGICEDEGVIRVKVRPADNHELADTVTVFVTNQGTNCGVSVDDIWLDNGPLFRPNPAGDVIQINHALPAETRIQVFDLTGRLATAQYLYDGYTLSVGDLKPGIYIVGINSPRGGSYRAKLIIR